MKNYVQNVVKSSYSNATKNCMNYIFLIPVAGNITMIRCSISHCSNPHIHCLLHKIKLLDMSECGNIFKMYWLNNKGRHCAGNM